MKELHFYIQSGMLLLAIAIAVQLPLHPDLILLLLILQFVLGLYQYGMSWLLMIKLRVLSVLLKLYCYATTAYLLTIIVLGLMEFSWMTPKAWIYVACVMPWGFALFFIVVTEDLLRLKPKHI